MFLASLALVLVGINDLVSGQQVSDKRPVLDCASYRCPEVVYDCDSLRSYSHCCSICSHERRCFYKGKWYQSGESFKDSCNSCFCSNGLVRCTMRACIDLSCSYKGKVYPHGSSFKDDCNSCKCSYGKVTCTKKGCAKGCLYKGKYYKNGETFKDDCNTCNCRQGMVGCTKIGCLPKKCTYKGKIYKEGQIIPSKDPCTICHCRKGVRDCSIMMCPHVHCLGQRRIPGKCCPVCEDITI